MTAAIWTILGIYSLVIAGWCVRHVLLSLPGPLGLVVQPGGNSPARTQVSVVVPARNERDRIAPCIESLLRQGSVVGEVIVVDDRSRDGTADLVREVAGDDPRVHILRVEALPPAWSGKAHACHVGGQAAVSPWLLFTDADCEFLPDGIAGAVDHAERHDLDFLTLWPRADHRTFWEHLLIPLCGALILYWFPPFWANRPGSRLGYATGQFILIRRDAYRRLGGHECARSAVIEDIPLARHAKAAGLRTRAALGSNVVSVRMYTCFREIRDGWTRIFIGALQRPWKLLWSVWSLIGGSLLPSIGAPVAAMWTLLGGWPASPSAQVLFLLLWLHFFAVYTVSFRAWGLCRCDRRYLLLYPVSCLVVMQILLRSWWWLVTDKPILWRGSVTGAQEGHPTDDRPRTSVG